jgi:hypothetical protein
MFGSTGLAKIDSSFFTRPPALRVSRPRLLRTHPPFQVSWSW